MVLAMAPTSCDGSVLESSSALVIAFSEFLGWVRRRNLRRFLRRLLRQLPRRSLQRVGCRNLKWLPRRLLRGFLMMEVRMCISYAAAPAKDLAKRSDGSWVGS